MELDIDLRSSKAVDVRDKLVSIARDFISRASGLRRNVSRDIFERLGYVGPDDVYVENYLRRRPLAIFNPGAVEFNKKLFVFPRTIFDYYWYVSSIGLFELSIDALLMRELATPMSMRIVMGPTEWWEMYKGCEDPRVAVYGDRYYVLYTAVGMGRDGELKARQALAIMNRDLSIVRKLYFKLRYGDKTYTTFWKDSAVIEVRGSKAYILTRPSIPFNNGFIEINWWAIADLDTGEILIEDLKPVMSFEKDFEYKVGWSTNVYKISSNEYLVGWHGVGHDMVYRNGLAIVSNDGELLGITDYVLEPQRNLIEFYGDRPGVIFGNGLIVYGDGLLWIGGVSDYAIGFFYTDKEKIYEYIRSVKTV